LYRNSVKGNIKASKEAQWRQGNFIPIPPIRIVALFVEESFGVKKCVEE